MSVKSKPGAPSEAAERLALLLGISNAAAEHLDLERLLEAIAEELGRKLDYELTSLTLLEPDEKHVRCHALHFPAGKGFFQKGQVVPVGDTPAGQAIVLREPHVIECVVPEMITSDIKRALVAEGLKSGCCVPLVSHGRVLGTLDVGSVREAAFNEAALELLVQVATQIAPAVDKALAYRELAELKNRLAAEKQYLEGELRTQAVSDIIGDSAAVRELMASVATVAQTDATVLVSGETGTGKELVARAIHDRSTRRDRSLVKLNCAAIPSGLLESELFGHEKGAFTGAVAQRIGRFELAHQGTLFLDEVGEIPLELQSKLLRVLQEQSFERIGGSKTISVDVRIVAATNRDLASMVEQGRFRGDLFYRLNVFPLRVPALRERRDDVPLLVRHFVQKHSRRLQRRIETLPEETLEALARADWPGNVRELENFVERSLILSPGTTLTVPPGELARLRETPPTARLTPNANGTSNGSVTHTAANGPSATPAVTNGAGSSEPRTLLEHERELILSALKATSWRVGGPDGAAARLGMNRTTLNSRLRKLGIARPRAV